MPATPLIPPHPRHPTPPGAAPNPAEGPGAAPAPSPARALTRSLPAPRLQGPRQRLQRRRRRRPSQPASVRLEPRSLLARISAPSWKGARSLARGPPPPPARPPAALAGRPGCSPSPAWRRSRPRAGTVPPTWGEPRFLSLFPPSMSPRGQRLWSVSHWLCLETSVWSLSLLDSLRRLRKRFARKDTGIFPEVFRPTWLSRPLTSQISGPCSETCPCLFAFQS